MKKHRGQEAVAVQQGRAHFLGSQRRGSATSSVRSYLTRTSLISFFACSSTSAQTRTATSTNCHHHYSSARALATTGLLPKVLPQQPCLMSTSLTTLLCKRHTQQATNNRRPMVVQAWAHISGRRPPGPWQSPAGLLRSHTDRGVKPMTTTNESSCLKCSVDVD